MEKSHGFTDPKKPWITLHSVLKIAILAITDVLTFNISGTNFTKKRAKNMFAHLINCMSKKLSYFTRWLIFSIKHIFVKPFSQKEIIADTILASPRYHWRHYQCKIWSLVIIIAHRWFFGAMITATLLDIGTEVKLLIWQVKNHPRRKHTKRRYRYQSHRPCCQTRSYRALYQSCRFSMHR